MSRDVTVDDEELRAMEAELAALRSENERLKAERTWQPISETPDDNDWKILSSFAGCFPGYYEGCWRDHEGDDAMRYIPATHWMPLPEPPKEEKLCAKPSGKPEELHTEDR